MLHCCSVLLCTDKNIDPKIRFTWQESINHNTSLFEKSQISRFQVYCKKDGQLSKIDWQQILEANLQDVKVQIAEQIEKLKSWII